MTALLGYESGFPHGLIRVRCPQRLEMGMLRDEIDNAKRTVNTDTVSISVGEVSTMYSEGELNVLPEFQRLFRWSDEKKSNFVESILVGIPIPPAFVYEDKDGRWELIDGLQRISTILEFMGVLKDPDSGELRRSKLVATKYLPSLSEMYWKSQTTEERGLDTSLQLFFRRHRIDFQILKHPSDPKTKFDLFQRLNRGGAYANEQEVRTCSMVLSNPDVTRRLRDLCNTDGFRAVFRVTPEQKRQQRGLDYATRVLVHTSQNLPLGFDVQDFLDRGIIELLTSDSASSTLATLGWAVNLLHAVAGGEALIPPDERIAGIAPRFSLRALEGIVVGITRNRETIEALPDAQGFVRERIASFWQQPEVAAMSAAGLRGTVRLQRTVPFGSQWFNPNA